MIKLVKYTPYIHSVIRGPRLSQFIHRNLSDSGEQRLRESITSEGNAFPDVLLSSQQTSASSVYLLILS